MHYCVAYDISSNRLRLKVAKWCRKAGLRRIQRSVFIGPSPTKLIVALEQDVRALLPPTDRFVLIPLDNNAFSGIVSTGTFDLTALLHRPLNKRY